MSDEIRLIDIIDKFISGDWGEETATEDSPCAVSCVRGADIVPITNSRFENIPVRYISAASLKNRELVEGDIIIEKSGGSPTQSTGRTVYVSRELVDSKQHIICSNFCQAFRLKPGWHPLYVYYFLQVVYNSGVFFNFEGKTSGLRNLILDTAFKSIKIRQIPLAEQEKIANLISLVDVKIATNVAINDNLEALARQLYDYWFVQFDFPDENGNPYKSSGGQMEWDERLKREIPKGWEVCKVGDILDKYPSTKKYDTNEYLPEGNFPIIDQGDKYIVGFTNEPDNLLHRVPAVVFGDHSTRVKYIEVPFARGADGTQILYSNNTRVLPHFLYLNVSSMVIPNPGYSRHFKYLKELPMCVPPLSIALSFEQIVAPLFKQWTGIIFQNEELRRQQNFLLPLVINGQVECR